MNQEEQVESVKQEPAFIKRNEVNLPPNTSEREQALFGHLVNAAIGFELVFKKQIQDPFYPTDASDEEIKNASEKDSNILDHYTKVRKIDGTLVAQGYNETDSDVMSITIENLLAASELTSNPGQKNYLLKLSEALANGNYKDAERAKAEMEEEPLFDITLGYFEKYMDRRFSTKFAAMAWVGVKDSEKTNLAQEISDKYLDAYGWKGSRVRTRVEKTAVFSGFIATAPSIPSATSLPNQNEWREEFGTRIIFFENSFEQFIENQIPTLRKISDEASDYTDDEIRQISFKLLAAHESFHPAVRHENDEARLGNEFTYVNELLPELLALKVSRDLLGDLMTEKEIKLAIPLIISKALTLKNRGMPSDNPYMKGWATILNSMTESGSMSIEDGKLKVGTNENIRDGVEKLTQKLDEIAKNGNAHDALDLQNRYGSTNIFDQFNLQ